MKNAIWDKCINVWCGILSETMRMIMIDNEWMRGVLPCDAI